MAWQLKFNFLFDGVAKRRRHPRPSDCGVSFIRQRRGCPAHEMNCRSFSKQQHQRQMQQSHLATLVDEFHHMGDHIRQIQEEKVHYILQSQRVKTYQRLEHQKFLALPAHEKERIELIDEYDERDGPKLPPFKLYKVKAFYSLMRRKPLSPIQLKKTTRAVDWNRRLFRRMLRISSRSPSPRFEWGYT